MRHHVSKQLLQVRVGHSAAAHRNKQAEKVLQVASGRTDRKRYNFGNGWQFFAKLNNVFDREYNNAGLLGEHRFDASTGQFTGNEVTPAFYAPGAPRAGWFGLRYAFGGNKSASSVDLD